MKTILINSKDALRQRRGSATILALMVSMLLMALVVGTMSLTIADTRLTMDNARNKKTFQAADSGLAQGRRVLAHALTDLALPASTSVEDVETYAEDGEVGIESGPQEDGSDISLLSDAGPYMEGILPRDSWATSWHTQDPGEQNDDLVWYDTAYDMWPTSIDYPAAGDFSYRHVFHYDYRILSKGDSLTQAEANRASRTERGSFQVEVSRPNFATYGYFTNSMKNQFDDQLWFYDGEVYDGRTRVNVAPPEGRCAFWGQATFNGPFEAVQATYEESTLGGNANPQFNDSVTWGAEVIDTPSNGWSQLRAAIGDEANIEDQSQPSNAELRESLGLDVSDDPVPQGVYYSAENNASSSLLGGLLVVGNPTTMRLTQSGNEQLVEITMTSASGPFAGTHTWVFHDNPSSGTSYATMDGQPAGEFADSLNGLIHVEGSVYKLLGDGDKNTGDIESAAGITVSATGNIVVGDHLTYETDPTVDPTAENVLGIFSSGGNILLAKTAPSNLELDATVMATGDDKGVGAEGIIKGGGYDFNYPTKGSWNLLGGVIEDKNQTTGVFYSSGKVTGYTWNFTFDDRYSAGLAPPFFPYVNKFQTMVQNVTQQAWGRAVY